MVCLPTFPFPQVSWFPKEAILVSFQSRIEHKSDFITHLFPPFLRIKQWSLSWAHIQVYF